jgi:TRAP-type C4-dicarboxylate transport system substrate-binding protein
LPRDIQEIIREEAQRHEESTRTKALSIWNQKGVDKNTAAGMEYIELTPELKELMRTAALANALPDWVERAGGPRSNAVKVFNKKGAPILRIEITEKGKVREIE